MSLSSTNRMPCADNEQSKEDTMQTASYPTLERLGCLRRCRLEATSLATLLRRAMPPVAGLARRAMRCPAIWASAEATCGKVRLQGH